LRGLSPGFPKEQKIRAKFQARRAIIPPQKERITSFTKMSEQALPAEMLKTPFQRAMMNHGKQNLLLRRCSMATTHSNPGFWRRPATKLGWWAVGVMAGFIILFIVSQSILMYLSANTVAQPVVLGYGVFLILCGFSSGIMGMVAVFRKHERSWLVFLTILPLAYLLFLILGEFVGAMFGFTH
jgi:hypothetical protein